jgi:hypothetical protein
LITAYQLKMRQKKKQNKKHHREQTTFDPKLHYRGKGQTGYGLKNGVELDRSGSQLAHILDPK